MMDILSELRTVGLTALFNPTFLFLLILLFFLGKLVGWMTRNINIWKFLALAYFGIFLFRPLQDAGLIIGGVFILGVASMYLDLFRGIFGWAGGIGDVVSAFRFNGAYNDIRRLEREIEELKGQLRASQMAGAIAGGTAQQSSWRAQSQARKAKSQSRTGDGGRGGDSGASSGAGSTNRRSGGQQSSSGKRAAGEKEKRYGKGRSSRRSSAGAKPSGKDGVVNDGGKPNSSGSSKRGGASSRKRSAGAGPSSKQRHQKTSSQGPTGSQSRSQSQQRNQKTAGNQSRSQGQSGTAGSSPSPSLRDKHLTTLELVPGQAYTDKEIKTAWRKMAFKTHPDRGGSAAAFAECLSAYRALS